MYRKAMPEDIRRIVEIYNQVHAGEEAGKYTTGWQRGVYPTKETVRQALKRGDLFVQIQEGMISAVAVLNKVQIPVYADADWSLDASDEQVMVIHTLAAGEEYEGKGCARDFLAYYEQYARENGCSTLRLDTNERNRKARKLYKVNGYREAGIVSCVFNGIPGVRLVCLEKNL